MSKAKAMPIYIANIAEDEWNIDEDFMEGQLSAQLRILRRRHVARTTRTQSLRLH